MRRKEKPEEAGTGSTLFAFCCIVIQYAYMVVSEQDLRETGALPCRPVRKRGKVRPDSAALPANVLGDFGNFYFPLPVGPPGEKPVSFFSEADLYFFHKFCFERKKRSLKMRKRTALAGPP